MLAYKICCIFVTFFIIYILIYILKYYMEFKWNEFIDNVMNVKKK